MSDALTCEICWLGEDEEKSERLRLIAYECMENGDGASRRDGFKCDLLPGGNSGCR